MIEVLEEQVDAFVPVMGSTRGSGRVEPIALVEWVVATPVRPYEDDDLAAEVVQATHATAEVLSAGAEVLRDLAAAGWVLSVPTIADNGDGFIDLTVGVRKRFATSQEAETEALGCGATSDGGFSFGWDETVNATGKHDVEWWGEF